MDCSAGDSGKVVEVIFPFFRIVVLLLSFCSLSYELLLSQLSMVFVGSEAVAFSLVAGVYVCFMGIGALFVDRFVVDNIRTLIKVEYVLTAVGSISPFALILMDYWFSSQLIVSFVLFLFVSAVGLLTGMELPLLHSLDRGVSKFGVLVLNYFGALIAGLLFALFLYIYVDLFYSFFGIALLNLFVASYMSFFVLDNEYVYLFSFYVLSFFFIALNFSEINFWITNLYIG